MTLLVGCVQLVTRTKKMFVGGLSASTTAADVKAYFEQFGPVSSAHPHSRSHRPLIDIVVFISQDKSGNYLSTNCKRKQRLLLIVNFRLAVTYLQFLIQVGFLATVGHLSSFRFPAVILNFFP